MFDPTWTQSQYANTWWIDYAISGSVASASLEVVGGQTVTLASDTGTWAASPSSEIKSGTQVILRATDTSGRNAQTNAFGYLVTASPTTGSCP